MHLRDLKHFQRAKVQQHTAFARTVIWVDSHAGPQFGFAVCAGGHGTRSNHFLCWTRQPSLRPFALLCGVGVGVTVGVADAVGVGAGVGVGVNVGGRVLGRVVGVGAGDRVGVGGGVGAKLGT